jgi:hypothetical protein
VGLGAAGDKATGALQKFAKRKNFQDYQKKPSEQLCTQLVKAGLFPHLLHEISNSSFSENDLRALLAWSSHDESDTPTALFMGRLRASARPSKIYYQPPCPECGGYGRHGEGCRFGYTSGELADFIEHR